MRVVVVGRGNVGGGLAERWRRAGHEVTELGREGGDASGADVLVVAVPGETIADALATVSGVAGKTAIDATNPVRVADDEFPSRAHQVQAIVGGPTAKSFNLNFARIYDRLDAEPTPPSNLYAADDAAREVTERLIRDAGYEPVYAGDLEAAPLLEQHLALMFAINRAGLGPFFYRIAPPQD